MTRVKAAGLAIAVAGVIWMSVALYNTGAGEQIRGFLTGLGFAVTGLVVSAIAGWK